jgi:LCP family protein required for cell wall assembly
MTQLSKKRRSSKGGQIFFVASLALLFIVVSAGIGYIFFDQVRQTVAASSMLPEFFATEPGEDPETEPGTTLEPWQGNQRVNVLLLGVDERESEHGPWRTDTMIVLTVDPLTKSGGMLSIPRDLWVPIPGFDHGKINTANYLGDAYDYPGGGPALAMRTVEYNLGVPIHYYVRVNFKAFIELVDMIGGIDVYVEEEIDDPNYPSSDPNDPYGYEHLYIPAGMVHMDGELALKYARTRHSAGGDFDRATRQQQVMRAILEKVTRLNLLPQLVSQAPRMWSTLSDSVETDLTLDQIVSLAHLATQVPPENIRTAVISGPPYTEFHETTDGLQVLYPVRDKIRELVDYIFTVDTPSLEEEEDPTIRLEQENATVEVQNGTGIAGLAQTTSDYLEEHSVRVETIGNADRSDYAASFIYVYNQEKTFTAEYIAETLGLPAQSVVPQSTTGAEVDIRVILGADYELPAGATDE